MNWRTSRAAVTPVSEPTAVTPEEIPGDNRAWIRNALWMLAGYFLLRLIENSLRPARTGQTRGSLRA